MIWDHNRWGGGAPSEGQPPRISSPSPLPGLVVAKLPVLGPLPLRPIARTPPGSPRRPAPGRDVPRDARRETLGRVGSPLSHARPRDVESIGLVVVGSSWGKGDAFPALLATPGRSSRAASRPPALATSRTRIGFVNWPLGRSSRPGNTVSGGRASPLKAVFNSPPGAAPALGRGIYRPGPRRCVLGDPRGRPRPSSRPGPGWQGSSLPERSEYNNSGGAARRRGGRGRAGRAAPVVDCLQSLQIGGTAHE
jgi:hypothetical protein